MNTITWDFIERQPRFNVEPDAEYTCTVCYYHGTVANAKVANEQVFKDFLSIHCGRCGRHITLIQKDGEDGAP